jgi:hypothetical protein
MIAFVRAPVKNRHIECSPDAATVGRSLVPGRACRHYSEGSVRDARPCSLPNNPRNYVHRCLPGDVRDGGRELTPIGPVQMMPRPKGSLFVSAIGLGLC